MKSTDIIYIQDWMDPESKSPRGSSLHLSEESCKAYLPADCVVKARKWHKVLAYGTLKETIETNAENGGYWVQEQDMDPVLDNIFLPQPPTAAFHRGFRLHPEVD